MPRLTRFPAARRHARALVGAACLAAASHACAQSTPSLPAPVTAWRPPTLQVQGAEQPVRLTSLQVDVEVAGGAAETRVQMVFSIRTRASSKASCSSRSRPARS
jgi:hypothetical protein